MVKQTLTTIDHCRDVAGLEYVYPVLSRRAGGLSIGINFNTNNACNWRCVYCQVPNLVRGNAPAMDFQLLAEEFRFFLDTVRNGGFFDRFNVPKELRVIKDIAISGNGEPTSLRAFDKAVLLIGQLAQEKEVLPLSQFVLITNGSLIHRTSVQKGLKILNDYQGQVWFKLDSATESRRRKINNSRQTNKSVLNNLKRSSALCETHLQTCVMDFLSCSEKEDEKAAYLNLLGEIKKSSVKVNKIMFYTTARPSLQPEAMDIKKRGKKEMNQFAKSAETLGYQVTCSY